MILKGISVSEGYAQGKVKFLSQEVYTEDSSSQMSDANQEIAKLESALEISKNQIQELVQNLKNNLKPQEAEIFEAHLMMLEDPEILSQVKNKIQQDQVRATLAWKLVLQEFIEMFKNIEDEYLKQRATDLEDICGRVLNNFAGKNKKLEFNEDVILFAEDLTPSQTASLDLKHVKGFITEIGGKTSHSAILARALEIPAISGISKKSLTEDLPVLLNAMDGQIILDPTTQEKDVFRLHALDFIETKKEFLALKGKKSETKDGHPVELAANIGTLKDMNSVQENDAEAIGLYRTEFVFMDQKEMPTEETQFQIYKSIFEKNGSKKCIIRTLDIGGDKKLDYLHIAPEMNPFLGLRAVRLSLKEKNLFKDQIRAILRAAFQKEVWVMIPMISKVEEILEVKKVFAECEEELLSKKIPFSKEYKFGVMIEVPSAALVVDTICEHVDFISIGTNDLIQYTCAVDRLNTTVEDLYDPFHPGFLRLMAAIIRGTKEANKFAGICGSIAHKKELVPYFVGLGIDELSMTAQHILPTRKLLQNLNFEDCKKIAHKVLKAKTSAEVKSILNENL